MFRSGKMWRDPEILSGLFFLIFGIAVIIGALGLPLGTPLEPKPGFFPLLAGIFLSALSFIYLIRLATGSGSEIRSAGVWTRPAGLIAGLGVYTLILNFVGYLIATILLSVIVLRVLETPKWWRVIVLGSAAALSSYLLFDVILGVTLPPGLLKGLF